MGKGFAVRKEKAMQKTLQPVRSAQNRLDDTQKATAKFEALVQNIPGILAIRVRGENLPTTKTYVVTVPSLFGEEAQKIYELEGKLFRKFPAAYFEVRVVGVRESGIPTDADEIEDEE